MSKIAVDQLSEGMVVEETVTDLHGTILLQKGAIISRNGITLMKMWGVMEVSIDDESAEEHPLNSSALLDPRFVEEAKHDVAVLFQHTDRENLFVRELVRLATNRIARSKAERKSTC